MQKLTIKEQAARVMAFVRDEAPKAVLYHAVMYEFDISATKAQNICKVAASISEVFEYEKGTLKYTGDPKVFDSGHKTLEDAFQDTEETEDSVQYSEGEARQIFNILKAEPITPEDKGSLKTSRQPKKRWNPNDVPH